MNINKKKNYKISASLLVLIFIIFPIMKPEQVALATLIGSSLAELVIKALWLWNIVGYILTLYLLLKYLAKKLKIKIYTWLMIGLVIALLFSTLRIGGWAFRDIWQLFGNYIMIAILASVFSGNKYLRFLQAWYYCLTFWMVINSVTIFRYYPKGMYAASGNDNYYLFALDNVSFLISLTGFFVGFVYNKVRYNKLKIIYIIWYAFIGCSYFYCKAGTGMAITVLCVLSLLFYNFKFFELLNYRKTLIVLITSFLIIVVFQSVTWAMGLLNLIGKDLTYNGRIDIWYAAINVLPNNILFGFGTTTSVVQRALSTGGVAWISGIGHLHNFLLEFLFKGGIVSLVFIILFFIFPLKNMPIEAKNPLIRGINLILIAIWIAFIFEYRLNLYSFWVVLFTLYNIKEMINSNYVSPN